MKAPDLHKMSLSELRLYHCALWQMVETLNAQSSRPLAMGPESTVSSWIDDAIEELDCQLTHLVDHLKRLRFQGISEKLRLCLILEHHSRVGIDLDEIAQAMMEAGRRI